MASDTINLVKDINPGAADSLPADHTLYNGNLYFSASGNNNDQELWISDGTETGTIQLKDINAGNNRGSFPSNFTVFNGRVYFAADDGLNGRELWVSDGSQSGTTLFKDINAGTNKGAYPTDLTVFNNKLYFSANDGVNGQELWVSDGTPLGTKLVQDINPGSASSSPSDLTPKDNQLYFTADDGVSGAELWALKPSSTCEYPLDAPITNVQPWETIIWGDGVPIADLLDISGADQQTTTFVVESITQTNYREAAMTDNLASTYPPSGNVGDFPMPSTGIVGYQVDVHSIFNPEGVSSSVAELASAFYSMNSAGQGVSVVIDVLYNANPASPIERGVAIIVQVDGTTSGTVAIPASTFGESGNIGISIDRDNQKIYYSINGSLPTAIQDSNGQDVVYNHNIPTGTLFVFGNTGYGTAGDPIVGSSASTSLVTCAAQMNSQMFPANAIDISGTAI